MPKATQLVGTKPGLTSQPRCVSIMQKGPLKTALKHVPPQKAHSLAEEMAVLKGTEFNGVTVGKVV